MLRLLPRCCFFCLLPEFHTYISCGGCFSVCLPFFSFRAAPFPMHDMRPSRSDPLRISRPRSQDPPNSSKQRSPNWFGPPIPTRGVLFLEGAAAQSAAPSASPRVCAGFAGQIQAKLRKRLEELKITRRILGGSTDALALDVRVRKQLML